MKWFHHEVDSMHSEKLTALIAEFGFEGYGRYWRILEIVAERMDGSGRYWAEFPITIWLQKLAVRRPLFNRYLVVISQLFDIKVISSELLLRIEIPNLLKWQDNYTKDLEAKSKKLTSKERDKERDKEKTFKTLVHPGETPAEPVVEKVPEIPQKKFTPKKFPESFEKVWKLYPHPVGKKNAFKHFSTSVDPGDTSQIEIALQIYKNYVEAVRANGRNLEWQNGSTWFNQWQDWLTIKDVPKPPSRDQPMTEDDRQREIGRENWKKLKAEAEANERAKKERDGDRGNAVTPEQHGRGNSGTELPDERKPVDLSGEDPYHAGRILQRMQQKNLSSHAESGG